MTTSNDEKHSFLGYTIDTGDKPEVVSDVYRMLDIMMAPESEPNQNELIDSTLFKSKYVSVLNARHKKKSSLKRALSSLGPRRVKKMVKKTNLYANKLRMEEAYGIGLYAYALGEAWGKMRSKRKNSNLGMFFR